MCLFEAKTHKKLTKDPASPGRLFTNPETTSPCREPHILSPYYHTVIAVPDSFSFLTYDYVTKLFLLTSPQSCPVVQSQQPMLPTDHSLLSATLPQAVPVKDLQYPHMATDVSRQAFFCCVCVCVCFGRGKRVIFPRIYSPK